MPEGFCRTSNVFTRVFMPTALDRLLEGEELADRVSYLPSLR